MSRYRFKIWRGTERWWRPWRFEITGPIPREAYKYILARAEGRAFTKRRAIKAAKERIEFYRSLYNRQEDRYKAELETEEWHDG